MRLTDAARDLLPWEAVHARWRQDSAWQRVHNELRRQVRVASDRQAKPMADILDSQSVRTGGKRGATMATMRASK